MKRQIELRFWSGKKYIHTCVADISSFDFDVFDIEPDFQQFTGLKDKNSKKIFEGDIVRYTEKMHEHGDAQECIAVVKYDEKAAAFGIGRKEIWNYFFDYGVSNIEVIGNIHENPELLK